MTSVLLLKSYYVLDKFSTWKCKIKREESRTVPPSTKYRKLTSGIVGNGNMWLNIFLFTWIALKELSTKIKKIII